MGWYPKLGDDSGAVYQILGWLAFCSCIYLFGSPLTTCWSIRKNASTMSYSDTPYVVSLINCILWIVYSYITGGRFQAFVTNVFGAVMELFFICVFLYYHPWAKRKWLLLKVLLVALGFGTLAAVCSSFSTHTTEDVVGIVADVFNALMYGAPLGVMFTVIKTRSVESMPLGLTVGCLFASLCWGSYALWVGDAFMGLPNDVGVFLGIGQVVLYTCYRKSPGTGVAEECLTKQSSCDQECGQQKPLHG